MCNLCMILAAVWFLLPIFLMPNYSIYEFYSNVIFRLLIKKKKKLWIFTSQAILRNRNCVWMFLVYNRGLISAMFWIIWLWSAILRVTNLRCIIISFISLSAVNFISLLTAICSGCCSTNIKLPMLTANIVATSPQFQLGIYHYVLPVI